MSTKLSEARGPVGSDAASAPVSGRRPYVKPGFQVSAAFERQALACSGCLNLAPAPPAFCALRS
jgi:hypothetical protein